MQRKLLAIFFTLSLGLLALTCGGGGGGGGGPTEPPPPPPPPPGGSGQVVTVEVVDHDFNPGTVVVNAGDTVRWVMRGSQPGHTVTALNGAFDSGFAFNAGGAIFQHTFTAANNGQTFEYSCTSHAACCNMRGSVRVGASAPPPRPGYE